MKTSTHHMMPQNAAKAASTTTALVMYVFNHQQRPGMMIWKDSTSYAQGQAKIPTAWSTKAGQVSVTVTSGHINNPGRWTMHCRPWFDTQDMGLDDQASHEEAQETAINMVRAVLQSAIDEMNQQ